jgi:hypothetical protein
MSRTNTKMSPTNAIIIPQAKIHCATAASPCIDRSDSDGARTIHECPREAFEAEFRRGFSQVGLAGAYLKSVGGGRT